MRKMKRKRVGSRITLDQAEEIRRLVRAGTTLTAICAQYGISKPYASLIARNLRKKRNPANVA
jgi:hypothetical protein